MAAISASGALMFPAAIRVSALSVHPVKALSRTGLFGGLLPRIFAERGQTSLQWSGLFLTRGLDRFGHFGMRN